MSPRSDSPPPRPDETDEASEAGPGLEFVETWDEAASVSGVRVQPIPEEDEFDVTRLVQEGVDEAERETRLEAETELGESEETDDTNRPADGILS